MKRVLACILIVAMLPISFAVVSWAAGAYGTSGVRTYKLYNPAEYNPVTGFTKQSGAIQQVMVWWSGTTAASDTLCDTVYTDWVNIGSRSGMELYSIRATARITATDSIASWDSADTYTIALQSCMNPFTADSTLISTMYSFTALTDTGTGTFYAPQDSITSAAWAYFTPYVRSRIIVRAVIDTAAWWVAGFYTQATYLPITYETHYKPIWH